MENVKFYKNSKNKTTIQASKSNKPHSPTQLVTLDSCKPAFNAFSAKCDPSCVFVFSCKGMHVDGRSELVVFAGLLVHSNVWTRYNA